MTEFKVMLRPNSFKTYPHKVKCKYVNIVPISQW